VVEQLRPFVNVFALLAGDIYVVTIFLQVLGQVLEGFKTLLAVMARAALLAILDVVSQLKNVVLLHQLFPLRVQLLWAHIVTAAAMTCFEGANQLRKIERKWFDPEHLFFAGRSFGGLIAALTHPVLLVGLVVYILNAFRAVCFIAVDALL
jgi:hypothetical protein